MTAPTLRPYQQAGIDQMREIIRAPRAAGEPAPRILWVMPTGAGKGAGSTYIIHGATSRGASVIFLVNRKVLVHDMSGRLRRLGIEHGVIMGSHARQPWHRVQVASIDTLHRRENLPKADLIFVDEAHFAVSLIWSKVLDRYPDAVVIGMTATPIRRDGRGLGEIFGHLVNGPTVTELQALEYLVPSVVFAPSEPDMSGVGHVAGEFNEGQTAHVVDQPKLIGDIVQHWKRYASDRKSAYFCVTVAHSQHVAEAFRCAGIDWAHVDADTPDEERDRIWDGIDRGSLRGVSSVGVISYGWDHPVVSCVGQLRPTESEGLHLQQIGRGLRIHPGKRDLLVLDHAGNYHRHGKVEDPREWTLEGRVLDDTDKERVHPVSTCPQCFLCFPAGPRVCPACGFEIPRLTQAVIEPAEGELREVSREEAVLAKLAAVQSNPKFQELMAWRDQADRHGYKAGYPAVMFKAKHGHWPPRGWLDAAKVATDGRPVPGDDHWEFGVEVMKATRASRGAGA